MQLADFTDDEIAEAESMLMHNIYEFYSDTDIGHRLRQSAIELFKKQNNLKSSDFEQIVVEADLLDDVDICNALRLEEAYRCERPD